MSPESIEPYYVVQWHRNKFPPSFWMDHPDAINTWDKLDVALEALESYRKTYVNIKFRLIQRTDQILEQ